MILLVQFNNILLLKVKPCGSSLSWLLTARTIGLVHNAFRQDFRSGSVMACVFQPLPLYGSAEGWLSPPLLLPSVAWCTPLYFPSRKNHKEVKWVAEGVAREGRCLRKKKGKKNVGIIPAFLCWCFHHSYCILLYHSGSCLCSDTYSRAWGWE